MATPTPAMAEEATIIVDTVRKVMMLFAQSPTTDSAKIAAGLTIEELLTFKDGAECVKIINRIVLMELVFHRNADEVKAETERLRALSDARGPLFDEK